MITERTAFDPAQIAARLREAAADLRRHAPSCRQRATLAIRLERRASAILRPDIINDLEETLAARMGRLTRAGA